jgi:thioredoxin reductase (NADPH)
MFKELIDSSRDCSDIVVQVIMERVTSIREYTRDNNPLRVLIVGSPHDAECRNARTFLATNRISYEWVDGAKDPDRFPSCVSTDFNGSFALVDGVKFVANPLNNSKSSQRFRDPNRTRKDPI